MAKRCKHELVIGKERDGTLHRFDRSILHQRANPFYGVVSATCAGCGEQLSLGESVGRRSGANALAKPTASMLAEAELHERAEIQKMRHANDLGRLAEKMERSGHLDSTISHVTGLVRVEVITGPEPEPGIEVPIETDHTCSDRSLDCAACDVADDEERGDSTACEACGTSDGCARHRKFTCATCHRLVSWSDGAADDCPDDCSDCSDCWAAKQPAPPSACTPASCAHSCPLRVRSDDPAPVESEIGGEACGIGVAS